MTESKSTAFPDPQGTGDNGLTKREYFAAMALQGILANSHSTPRKMSEITSGPCTWAVLYADALIEALNKEVAS